MFQKSELTSLQLQKDLLVLQSNANRLLLAAEWQRVRSPELWLNEAGGLACRHPLWTTALATATGLLAVQAVRQPGAGKRGLGSLGKFAATAFSAWRLFRKYKTSV